MPEGRLKKFFREQLEQKEVFSKLIDDEIEKFASSGKEKENSGASTENGFLGETETSASSLLEWSRHREERNLALCQEVNRKISRPAVNQLLKEQELAILSSLNRLKVLAQEEA